MKAGSIKSTTGRETEEEKARGTRGTLDTRGTSI